MKNNQSIFQGWYENNSHRVESVGNGIFRVFEKHAGAFVLIATVLADSAKDAIGIVLE